MNAQEILDHLRTQPQGAAQDIPSIRNQIHEAKKHAATEAEHVLLLQLFQTVMDSAERSLEANGTANDLAEFRKLRDQDYCLLLVQECLQGSDVNSDLLEKVTRREVEGGRMAEDHELRVLGRGAKELGIATTDQLRTLATQDRHRKAFADWRHGMFTRFFGWLRRPS